MTSSTFASLPGVSAAVAATLGERGILRPFEIQERVIPLAIDGGDVLAQAPTGSGKTIAFGLPLVHFAAGRDGKPKGPDSLVLVPTRELAVQVQEDLEMMAGPHGLKIAVAYGGAGIGPQVAAVRRCDILVATPGRLIDLIERGDVNLTEVMTLVLDEADRMLDMGFAPQVKRIVRELRDREQTMLFSATLDGTIKKMIDEFTRDATTVRVMPKADAGLQVEHVFEETPHDQRVETLVRILRVERELAVVFVRTKRGADRLAKKLRARGVNATAIHGGMTQSARLRELAAFRAGTKDVLVATDVFARGIDLDDISHVINYDPPGDADTYMHRIGRTGRAGRSGTGISLVSPDQLEDMLGIAREIGLVDA